MLDQVFPPEHSDFELGDAYEKRGLAGVLEVHRQRMPTVRVADLRTDVALAFDVSPGDIVPYDIAWLPGYVVP